jgi:hypothetical protein
MAYQRSQHNLVVLPDGRVWAVGGSDDASLGATTGITADGDAEPEYA